MGFSSQAGYVAFMTQASADTFPAGFADDAVVMRHKSGSLSPNRELMIPDAEIGGNRDVPDAYLGASSWSGDIEFYARYEALATLLYGAFGAKAVSTTTGVSTHTFTPAASAVPWLAFQEKVSDSFEVFDYTDVKVNTIHFEAEANGYLMGTAGLIARKQLAGGTEVTDAAAQTDTTPMTVGTNITISYNGVTLPAKSFSFDLNNNMEDDDFRLGSFYLGDVTEKRRELTMGCTIRPQDADLWKQAVYGVSSASAPGGLTTKQQVVITMTSYEDIAGGTPATKYSLTLTVPKATIKPYGVDPSGDDVIENDLEIQALRPAPGTNLVTAVLKNGLAAVA